MNKKIEEYKKSTRNSPGYYDYKNMPHEFRPYIMFSNADNYNTKFISTDKFGFRKTVNQQGKKIELNEFLDIDVYHFCRGLEGWNLTGTFAGDWMRPILYKKN